MTPSIPAAEKYSPLYFLASLGAGGLSVTFFMYLMFWVPHPDQSVPVFEDITAAFASGGPLLQAAIVVAVLGIAVMAFLNLKLLVWNLRRFAEYSKTEAWTKLKNSNGETQVLAMPLALAMSVNAMFILGLVFVPGLWSVVEYLFPAALVAFAAIGWLAFRFIGDFLGRVLSDGGVFDVTANNSFAQLLPAFALAMVAVGMAAPAAMSTNPLTVGIALVMSIAVGSVAALYALVAAIVAFNSMLHHGTARESAPTLMVVVPILTILRHQEPNSRQEPPGFCTTHFSEKAPGPGAHDVQGKPAADPRRFPGRISKLVVPPALGCLPGVLKAPRNTAPGTPYLRRATPPVPARLPYFCPGSGTGVGPLSGGCANFWINQEAWSPDSGPDSPMFGVAYLGPWTRAVANRPSQVADAWASGPLSRLQPPGPFFRPPPAGPGAAAGSRASDPATDKRTFRQRAAFGGPPPWSRRAASDRGRFPPAPQTSPVVVAVVPPTAPRSGQGHAPRGPQGLCREHGASPTDICNARRDPGRPSAPERFFGKTGPGCRNHHRNGPAAAFGDASTKLPHQPPGSGGNCR